MSGTKPKPVLVGATELAAIYDGPPRNTAQWIQRGQLDYSQAVIISGRAYWTLGFAVALGEAFAREKTPNMAVVEELLTAQSPGRSLVSALTVSRDKLPPIVGRQEVAAMVNEDSNQWTARMEGAAKAGTFPEPDWYLSGSPLWLLDSALAGIVAMQGVARVKPPVLDESVVESLRGGLYDGPGSKILARGVKKKES
ncbi:hypothetical protein [Kitasatospora sp. NPDC058478]|uniref:hypothetical protein n=1 Tax=unclassified Kitasatospora TaxID=2633591 RepID=UPI0036636054